MGLTKQYLRYTPAGVFGSVSSKSCESIFLQPTRFIATGGTHVVNLWDTRIQRKLRTLTCESPALILSANSDATRLAIGLQSGGVCIYDLTDKSDEAPPEPNLTFEGHTSEVNTIDWDDSGTIIATGGKDTRVILWDCVAEAGIVKLKAHKKPVTRVRFWKKSKYLLSSSMDSTIRIWDLATHFCVHIIPGETQIWDIATWYDDFIFMAETHLKLYKVTEPLPGENKEWEAEELGTLLRHANDRRTQGIKIIENRYLLSLGAKSPEVELFHLNSPEIALKKMRKRLKKDSDGEQDLIMKDLVRRGESVRCAEGKVRSIDVIKNKDGVLSILCGLPSNQVQILNLNPNEEPTKSNDKQNAVKPNLLGFDGHRTIVRGIAFSSDKSAILTASADSFKVWNRSTLACVLTVNHEYPIVCCRFCPGDRHFIAGSTCGHLILCDVSTAVTTQIEQSGEESVWAVDVFPSSMGFAASNGKVIQFYDFSMVEGKLQFHLNRQLDVQETVLSIKISPNMKFIAAGLLDSTIKVFYMDTLKFHLSMYGHKLPVVSIDISADSRLLTSCAGDKSVKIWGLDFGDCHCTMLHTDGLVGCGFVENTHHVISVAKDSLNFYDSDIHQRYLTLKGHVEGGATCMALGGLHVATAGRDQTLRLFSRTEEILVLSDEREQEREKELERDSVRETPEMASLVTAETEKFADKLIEALDIVRDKTTISPIMQGYGTKIHTEFMLKVLSGIKAADLEQSIMLLPVSYVHEMIPTLLAVLQAHPLATELVVRAVYGLMKFHLASLNLVDKESLKKLASLAEVKMNELVDTVGFNLAGLDYINDRKVENQLVEEFKEMLGVRKRRKRNKEKALKRALLSVQMS